MTNKELDLTENAADTTIDEELSSANVEQSTENVDKIKIEETAKDNMNEQKDTIEIATEVKVEEAANTVQNEVVEETTENNVASEVVNTIEETPTTIEPITAQEVVDSNDNIASIEPIDEEVSIAEDVDYSNFTKKDFVELAEKLLASIKADTVSVSDVKNADVVMREIKPIFDDLKAKEKVEALKKYIADNGNNEGFEYKNDNYIVRFESLNAQIRDTKNAFFQKIERLKEDYFERKTQLLQRLREVVDEEEKGGTKSNWQEFKKIQEDWKNAGNVNSPHNTSLWSAYNALVDRYFSIRHIQNELKDLDRKKNFNAKADIVSKIEAIAQSIGGEGLSNSTLRQANDLLEEYKHIGPAAREAQEELWQRLKAAFDIIHNKRREQTAQANQLQDEIYAAKARLVENLKPYIQFNTDSINEWNAKTKEVMAIQDQWNAIKGAMPKDKGKEISREFWGQLKTFFRNKGDFFAKLEAQREENLKAKTILCEQVEALVASGDYSAAFTDKVVELQKTWKTIGHVPEKMKDKIYERFKKACDTFFDGKRAKGNAIEAEYEENLKQKIAICEEIEALAKSGDTQLSKLAEFKAQYNAIGFVPRKDMQSTQRRFVDAINSFVKGSSGISGAEKEKMVLQNEVEVVTKGEKGGSKELDKKENDIRRKMKTIEDDIHLWQNNIEFFARSKNASSVRAEYETKIKGAEKELNELKQKLKIIIAAGE
ncbi:protein of unknown function DUF349 [Emticicia oligotrophica DSM 17448]|uniref:DUF349 domain-containing protein n=1 Tax=Emticicia oligotrophica (strain DSM 17448 / CIP 109782 / MTCC 6937 / GPTSA100-15) TaxID=929562 RepID=A0ABM5MWW5_EMTOG|nr:DUF349 domain-containing protein [Emticicia oligotrophica]AFK01617.1 protein of unknown function DUF349 [Emticicia oligotrophica DSM 17448]